MNKAYGLAKQAFFILLPQARRLRDERDAANLRTTQANAERDTAIAERDAAITERDAAIAGLNEAIAERQTAIAGRDAAITGWDTAIAERLTAIAERDAANARAAQAEIERDSLRLQVKPPLSIEHSPEPMGFTYLPAVNDRSGNRLYQPPLGLFNPPYFAPLNIEISSELEAQPRLNILLPTTSINHTSGGPNTMYLLATEMAKAGIPIRLISVTAAADIDSGPIRDHITRISSASRTIIDRIEFADAGDRSKSIPMGENDVFFATAWWTAQMVKYLLPRFRCRRFAYLIQDYEPNLHPISSNSALALETYDLDYFPVVNSRLLFDHFVEEQVGRFVDPEFVRQGVWFEPSVDRNLYYPQNRQNQDKQRLLFYARPDVPRNLIEFGVAALMLLIDRGIIPPNHWSFHSSVIGVGGGCRPIHLAAGGSALMNPVPLHDITAWANELRQTDVLLSLIWSPHTSYPPLEAAASGAMVATNTCGVKTAERLIEISPNIVAGPPSIEGIADALLHAINHSKDWPARVEGAKLGTPETWEESFRPILPSLLGFFESAFDRSFSK